MIERVQHCKTCRMELLPYKKVYTYPDRKTGKDRTWVTTFRPQVYCDNTCGYLYGKKLV